MPNVTAIMSVPKRDMKLLSPQTRFSSGQNFLTLSLTNHLSIPPLQCTNTQFSFTLPKSKQLNPKIDKQSKSPRNQASAPNFNSSNIFLLEFSVNTISSLTFSLANQQWYQHTMHPWSPLPNFRFIYQLLVLANKFIHDQLYWNVKLTFFFK